MFYNQAHAYALTHIYVCLNMYRRPLALPRNCLSVYRMRACAVPSVHMHKSSCICSCVKKDMYVYICIHMYIHVCIYSYVHMYTAHICACMNITYTNYWAAAARAFTCAATLKASAPGFTCPPPPILFQRSEFVHINIRVCMLAPCLSLSHFSFSTLLLSSPLIFPLALSSSLALSFYYWPRFLFSFQWSWAEQWTGASYCAPVLVLPKKKRGKYRDLNIHIEPHVEHAARDTTRSHVRSTQVNESCHVIKFHVWLWP